MKKETIKFLVLLLIAIGAGPASASFWQWSKTAINNQTADPSINWSEGMSPSSVNDSARAMMARSAEQRDDTSGLLLTAGGPVTYTVTTNQGIQTPTPVDGQMISVTMNVTNGATPTLAADGGTPYPIQIVQGSPTAIPAGSLIIGTPYALKFSAAFSAWVPRNFYGQLTATIPLGGIIASTSPPPSSNFVQAYGQCISTTTYSAYWVLIGSPAPGVCGAGTFQIIDLRGRFLAGIDSMGGTGIGRLTSSATGCGTSMTGPGSVCANGAESQTLVAGHIPSITSVNGSQSISVSMSNIGLGGTNYIAYSPGSTITYVAPNSPGGGAFNVPTATAGFAGTLTLSGNGTTANSISVTSSGTNDTPFPRVPPTMAIYYLLRVL